MADLRAVLEKLSNEFGVSGRERAVRLLVKNEIEGLVDRLTVDALGNLITYKAGDGPEPRLRVMLSAHMDEVGFMITKVEKNGLLRFAGVGGPDQRTLLGKRVVIGDERLPGIIGALPPHLLSRDQLNRIVPIEEMAIDIGATGDKEAGVKVKVGDYATFATRFSVLSDDPAFPTVRGKAFDDRVGCTVLIGLLAEHYPVDIVGLFSVQEEVGLRGARVAAYRTEPDAAIALEGNTCDDTPRLPDEETTPVTRVGDGPAITIMDRSFFTHPGMLRLFRETAAAEGIPIQYRAPGFGGTDTGAIHLSRAGVPSIQAGIPCRYIHGPASILNMNDLTNTVRLAGAALRRINRIYLTREN
jgi:putative aminopeptidase FrvX